MGFYSCCHAKVNISGSKSKKKENLGQKDSRQAPRLPARSPRHGQGKEKGPALPIISSSYITCQESSAHGSHHTAGGMKRSLRLSKNVSLLRMLIQPYAVTPISPATAHSRNRTEIQMAGKVLVQKKAEYLQNIHNAKCYFKCFESGGGKHFPHFPIMTFPTISPFFSLLFFHLLLPSCLKFLIFRIFYFIYPFPLTPPLALFCWSALLLSVTSQNFTGYGKSHCDKREIQIFLSWCHPIIQMSSKFSGYKVSESCNF